MDHQQECRTNVSFRPTLIGCVSADHRLSKSISECYCEKLYLFSAYTYVSIMTVTSERELSERLEAFAAEEAEHFRLLGELILALDGNPAMRVLLRIAPIERKNDSRNCLTGAVAERLEEIRRTEKCFNERMETLMGRTEDRVVRSLLAYLIADGQRHIEFLQRATGSEKDGKPLRC